MRSRSLCNASVGLMPGLWKGARKMPKRGRWLIETFLRLYDGAFVGLLIRIKLAPDPPFSDRRLDRYDNRFLQRCHPGRKRWSRPTDQSAAQSLVGRQRS